MLRGKFFEQRVYQGAYPPKDQRDETREEFLERLAAETVGLDIVGVESTTRLASPWGGQLMCVLVWYRETS